MGKISHVARGSSKLNGKPKNIRSPMFWGWVRRQLRLTDLEDMREKRPVLGKMAYKARVKILFRNQKAQTMAK